MSDVSTWGKAKDTMLMAMAAMLVLGLVALYQQGVETKKDLADLKLQLAIYQTQQSALSDSHAALTTAFREHVKEDRDAFRRVGAR